MNKIMLVRGRRYCRTLAMEPMLGGGVALQPKVWVMQIDPVLMGAGVKAEAGYQWSCIKKCFAKMRF
jgi:hypothetical protein